MGATDLLSHTKDMARLEEPLEAVWQTGIFPHAVPQPVCWSMVHFPGQAGRSSAVLSVVLSPVAAPCALSWLSRAGPVRDEELSLCFLLVPAQRAPAARRDLATL